MRRIVLVIGLLVVLGGIAGLVLATLGGADPSAAPSGSTTSTSTGAPDTDPPDTEPPGSVPERDRPVFEEAACQFARPLGFRVECGYVEVPENRADPSGRTVRLHVARFPSLADEPAADALVYLDGGPGGEPLDTLQYGFEDRFAPFLEARDVIVFDQRGTGWSEPALDCPAYRQLGLDLLDDLLDNDEYVRRETEVLEGCKAEWAAAGIDLANFTSATNAADVADLRIALGYDSWNLFGISYGTRLALTVMRDAPEGIRSVVLDSTYPPEADGVLDFATNAGRAFDQLFSGCQSDPACVGAYGDLEARLTGLVDTWDREPQTVPVVDFLGGGRYEAVLDGDDILGVVFQSLYSETLIPSLPKLIDDLERGEVGLLSQTLSIFLANGEFFSPGMYFSVQCNEEVPFADQTAYPESVADRPLMALLADSTIIQSDRSFTFCAQWGSGVADPVENQPVDSDIPTLVLAGLYDPITPPSDGRAVAERLASAVYVEFDGLGHGVSTADPCPTAIMQAFLDDPDTPPDTSCAATLRPPDWVLPAGAEEPAEVEFVAFQADPFGLQFEGLVPEGWDEQFPGTFARLATGVDQTALVTQGYPGEFGDFVIDALLESLDLDRDPEELEPFDDGSRRWRWLRSATLGVELDVIAIEADGSTLMVMLLTQPDERDALIESVLRPVAASLQVSD